MQVYFDGSEQRDFDGHAWLTLAGLVGTSSFFNNFRPRWEQMLRTGPHPIAPYIHMSDLFSGNGPFRRDAGWTRQNVYSLVNQGVDLLKSFANTEFRCVVCSVDVTAYREISCAHNVSDPPTIFCTNVCLFYAFEWFTEHHFTPNPTGEARLYFDQGEKFLKHVKQRWQEERTRSRQRVKAALFWDRIAELDGVDMRTNPSLQVADILAWSRSRERTDRDYRCYAQVLRSVLPTTEVTLDEEALRAEMRGNR